MEYNETDFLMLSGIQHFAFCRRQWALIHIEMLWEENLRTIEGDILHETCHDGYSAESRKETIISRGMPIFSRTLGASGTCDIVEFVRAKNGVPLVGREGLYTVYPVEYKHGEPKERNEDLLQLAAQAICLEEMLVCEVPYGAIFYGKTRRRLRVEITDTLRQQVRDAFAEMHSLFDRGYVPKVKPTKGCNACSLKHLCLPKLYKAQPVREYFADCLRNEDEV